MYIIYIYIYICMYVYIVALLAQSVDVGKAREKNASSLALNAGPNT